MILPDKADKSGKHQLCYVLGAGHHGWQHASRRPAPFLDSTNGWQVNVDVQGRRVRHQGGDVRYVNKNIAIVLDNVVQSAPNINPGISGRNVTISGQFTEAEAKKIAAALAGP